MDRLDRAYTASCIALAACAALQVAGCDAGASGARLDGGAADETGDAAMPAAAIAAQQEQDAAVTLDGGNATAEPPPCEVEAPTECSDPGITFADIEPILEDHCLVCHYGMPQGPWPLTSYGHVASWHAELREVMLKCSMPPPEQRSEITTAEREQILQWLRCGYPQ